jgi:hypothetical protein
MRDKRPVLTKQMDHKAVESCHVQAVEAPTLDITELPEAKPDSPLYQEWNYYRSQVERLLADGHEGQFVLIKGKQIIGIWNSREEAKAVALNKYLMQPCLIHQVRRREPTVRMSARFWQCQS